MFQRDVAQSKQHPLVWDIVLLENLQRTMYYNSYNYAFTTILHKLRVCYFRHWWKAGGIALTAQRQQHCITLYWFIRIRR